MAYPFAAAEVLTAVDLNAMIGAPTQNAQTGTTYTAVLLDAGKTVTLSNASAVTLTIPAQASVSWADNTQLNFLNLGAGTVTITAAAGVTINGTPLTLATSKGGSLVRTASNVWTFIPFSGGVEAANFTNAATGTYTEDGIDYKFLTLTGSTSVDIDQAGFADILVIGGGAGGGNGGGGGAGGALPFSNLYLSATTHTVSIGAGGAAQLAGITSSISPAFGVGGGVGASGYVIGNTGGSGGGGGWDGGGLTDLAGGAGVAAQGNNGGAGRFRGAGAGGGAGAVGGNASTNIGGNGGAGASSSITGAAVTRAGGGGGGALTTGGTGGTGGGGNGGQGASGNATNGGANTGSGGGGGGSDFTTGGGTIAAGGSGVVIIRVVV